MRVTWRPELPEIFVHAAWARPEGLNGHPLHGAAKERRDINAADEIVRSLVNPEYLDDIFGLCYRSRPIVVAPVSDPKASRNALAATFAGFLANELEFELSNDIVQAGSTGRDMTRENWYRLTHEASFSGVVERDRNYIIADDVFTLGGTLAALHGFILDKEANVICMTTLAGTPKGRNPISLAAKMIVRLNKACGGELPAIVKEELGYEIDCLTNREAEFVLNACKSGADFRAGIARGRGQTPVG